MGSLASRLRITAVNDSGIDFERDDRYRCGVIIGSGIGGIETLEEQNKILITRGVSRVSPFTVPRLMVNAASGNVSILFKLHGPNTAVATACATGSNAIGDAARLIQHDLAEVMIAGGSEAALCELGMGSFCAARALSTRNDDPEHASRPWDRDRDGFVMGEGAGVVMLEEYEHAKKRGAKIYCELVGYGMSGDAYHITAPDEQGHGASRAMDLALRDAEDLCRPGRLHQRPRHQHAAGRSGRDQGDEALLRGPRAGSWSSARPRASSAICWVQAAGWRR